MEDTFGPPGQVFVHEFSKYRYGVFEEFGYPGDTKYPMFYYETKWTIDGQINEITPNFCTNRELTDYEMQDLLTGEKCNYDEETGLPDVNCMVVIGQNNSKIDSSIMALPFLKDNYQYCDDGEDLFHRRDIPTKHNEMCAESSVFEIVRGHEDFQDFTDGNVINKRKVTFEILRTRGVSNFVMVMDASASMRNNCKDKPKPCELRLDRLKQSATRWVKYDIKEDVALSLVRFDMEASRMTALKLVDEAYRTQIINKLAGMNTLKGTCIGAGIKAGLKALRDGGIKTGGVMIFLTDGEYWCPDGTDKSTLAEVIPLVKAQNVRVTTIAFSNDADPDIIKLATETNGKAYFVPDDSGPEIINTALQGSLTFQASVPSNEVDIIVYEESFKGKSSFETSFNIDDLLGKDVAVQIDLSGNPGMNIVVDQSSSQFSEVAGVFVKTFATLSPGNYNISGTTLDGTSFTYASIKVTSKAKNDTIPIMTNCWSSVGNSQADLSSGNTKIAINAKVLQGSNPVIGAKVVAYIERDGADAPVEIPLYDLGSAPDSVANDGVYARYFTRFEPNSDMTRYTLKCQVESTDGTSINEGFIDARSLPMHPSATNPICCGSNTLREDSILAPTGEFKRSSSGGVMEIENADKVTYPPGSVSNLKGSNSIYMPYFSLNFTSAGSQLDFGTADEFRMYYSSNITQLKEVVEVDDDALTLAYLSDNDVSNPESLIAQEAGTDVEIRVKKLSFNDQKQYFFRLVSKGSNLKSWSNIARVYITTAQQSTTTISTTTTTAGGAVALSSLLVCIFGLVTLKMF